jgi:hypothetical protein
MSNMDFYILYRAEMEITKNKNEQSRPYRCLNPYSGYGFLFGNHKHLAKVSRLLVCGIFLKILKIDRPVWIFHGFLVVLNVFHQSFVIITNLKFYKRCSVKYGLK